MPKWKKYPSLNFAKSIMARITEVERFKYAREMKEGIQDYTRLKNVETINKIMQNITEEEYNEILKRK